MSNSIPLLTGVELIAIERLRQIEDEGFSSEHDDTQIENELAVAASCYAFPDKIVNEFGVWVTTRDKEWPWDKKWWKPTPENRIKELQKAGALIAAEIDRLQRK